MSRPLRIGILGHWGGNIGHDMMALGVERIVAQAFAQRRYELVRIEQHRQFDIYPEGSVFRQLNRLGPWRGKHLKQIINSPGVSRLLWRASAVSTLDMGVACGGPFIAPGHYRSGEIGLMIHHMHGAFAHHNIPLFNLSVGSCYPYEHIPERIDDPDGRVFVRRMLDYCTVTTVRDETARRLCAELGTDCPLICCPAIVSGRAFEEWYPPAPSGDGFIVINYQERGANEDWGQNIDTAGWKKTVQELIGRLKTRHKVVFICHNDREFKLAAEVDPTLKRFQPKTLREYAEVIGGASTGLVSRVHAAIPLAGIGVSPILIGTDSRMGTLENIGVPAIYVKNATVDLLETELENRLACRKTESERLHALREATAQRYIELIYQFAGERVA
jgi:hypothetical protein